MQRESPKRVEKYTEEQTITDPLIASNLTEEYRKNVELLKKIMRE